jgi:hypothetical protein
VIKGGEFYSRSDFSLNLKYFVEAGKDTGFVAEVTSTHLTERRK